MRITNLKKYLILAIIGLFFTVSIAPNITGDINWINKSKKISINDNDDELTYSTISQIYYPEKDTYILERWPDSNRGTAYRLVVSNKYGSSPDFESDALIWFDLSDIPSGAITSTVTLNLYYFDYWDTDPIGRDISCYSITSNWDEYTTTFNNRPSYSSTITSYATIPSAFGWVSWDVTDDVRDFVDGIKTNYGWWIMDENYWGTGNIPQQLYYSREGTYIPYLDFDIESNNPPIANANGPYTGQTGELIQLDGTGSYDSDGNIVSYEWDLDNDGMYDDATGATPTFSWTTSGTHPISLKVTDDDGSTDTDDTTVEINNPPVADADGPYTGQTRELIQLDGTGSYDSNGVIVSYEWDIDNDGEYDDAIGEKPTYTWFLPGIYTISLRVTDNDGLTDTDITSAYIKRPDAPHVKLIYPTGGETLKDIVTIKWSAHDVEDGDNLPIYFYLSDSNGDSWSPFDGNPYENTGEYNWDTTLLPDGEYLLMVVAQDSNMNVGHETSDPFEIKNNEEPPVNNQPNKPNKPLGPIEGKTGEEYTYTTSTTDPDGDQVYYKWSWDDETSDWIGPYDSGGIINNSHIWDENGNYEIKVKSKDIHGAESEWSDPLAISMPKNRIINRLILTFLQQHPNLFPILRKLLLKF
ncbi:MAG: PKD domain-containing protein [Thermoplasmatales archaeon]|nr:MAG: PKD domain-containing protein [Thermoplasmatales archaeon]